MAETLALQRQFLRRSARMLLLSSPTVSRHLLSEIVEPRQPSASHLQQKALDVCTACGSLQVAGWTTSTKYTTKKVKQKGRANPKVRRSKRISQRCTFCSRSTTHEISMSLPPKVKKEESAHVSNVVPEVVPATEVALEKPAKSSSKKRAKDRKDRAGLQNLLNKSNQTKAVPSLSLMDLMKR